MARYHGSNLNLADLESQNLAYCIYTSGTTGNPKGVLIEHQSIVNSLNSHVNLFLGAEAEASEIKATIFSSVAFDSFLFELFSTVICGGEAHLLSDTVRLNPQLLSHYLIENKITNMDIVPAMLATLPRNVDYPNLQKIGYGGEECKADVGAFWSRKVQLFNSYGPTEASVVATGGFIDGSNMRDIGIPYHNSTCYILDNNLNLLPKLAVGELHLGGLGLARGYLNNLQETESKFINWRLPSEPTFSTLRLYRTGDLARWTLNGKLELFGRNDHQVNIRGYRVELGEIERTLDRVKGIQTSVVQLIKDSIIAYIVAGTGTGDQIYQSHETTIQILRSQLPSYMIPSSIIEIPKIPLKPTGKIDYSALPLPHPKNQSSLTIIENGISDQLETNTVPPRNELESELVDIFSSVLNVEGIGITDNFFVLGGDSVGCIQVIGAVYEFLGLVITVQDMFEHKTIQNLYDHVISKPALPSNSVLEPASLDTNIISQEYLERLESSEEIESISLANSLQEGFIFHALLRGENPGVGDAYNVHSIYKFHQKIEEPLYKRTWELMLLLYPALRLKFGWEEKCIQIIPKEAQLDYRYFDLRNWSMEERRVITQEIIEAEKREGYKLDQGKLFRVLLIRETESEYTNVFGWHHAILDGWSLNVLLSRVQEVYSNLVRRIDEQNFDLEPDSTYSATQKYYQRNWELNLSWWEKEIVKISQKNELFGLNSSSPFHLVAQAQTIKLDVPAELLGKLNDISKSHGVTLNAIFQFTWHQILHIFGIAGVDTTVTGTVVSGRNLQIPGIEHSVGLFINTLPMIVNHGEFSNGSILEALKIIQSGVNELNSRSCVPLSKLVSAGSANGRLFDSIFTFQNYPVSQNNQEEAELTWDFKELSQKFDYPLAVSCYKIEAKLEIHFEVCTQTLEQRGVQVMCDTFFHILHQIGDDVGKPIAKLTFVPLENKLVKDPKVHHGPNVLHGLFQEAALKYPDSAGLVFNGTQISYQTLNQKANQFAQILRKSHNIKSENLVPIFLERDENLIIAILGILKAGGAYVPIDTAFPDQRISWIVQDTNAKLVLTNEIHAKKLNLLLGGSVQVESIDDIRFIEKCDGSNLNLGIVEAENLAYCIYTSGTTGNPKGVLVEHRSIVTSIRSHANIFFEAQALQRTGERVKQTVFSSVAFDAFLCELFCTVICGGEFHLLSDTVRFNPNLLGNYLVENEITHIELIPAMLAILPRNMNYPNLQKICYGGDECKPEVAAFWSSKLQLFNGYGPTETSSVVTGGYVDGSNVRDIGEPYHNVHCFILDPNFNLLPPLAVGELHIGGPVLARGYLNNPQETQSKFINWNVPFKTSYSGGSVIRLYRTGDLARRTLSGRIEFFGRNDTQVKIRGYRIELGEIERSLENVVIICLIIIR